MESKKRSLRGRSSALFTLILLSIGAQGLSHAFSLSDYSDVLQLSTKFYGAQRSGSSDNWLISQYASPSPAPAACFTQDGISYQSGLDLSGGWHDAGDNIKFTLTIAWSAYALLKSYEAFPSVHADLYGPTYGGPNGIPDILDEVKWATDYLLKIHLDSAVLVSQIGDASDHNQGQTCVTMSKNSSAKGGDPRTVWFGSSKSQTTGTKADVMGITSAALSLMAHLYKKYDSVYAERLLVSARQLYRTAKARQGNTAEPSDQEFYADNSYLDDLACAAAEYGRATGDAALLNEAVAYSAQVKSHGWVVDWGQHIDYCRHTLAVAGKSSEVKAHWEKDISSYRTKVSASTYVKGLAFFSDWGSLRYALGAAFSAALYSSVYDDDAAKEFALSQIDYVMGNNEYNRSFIVGWGENAPLRPHHKNAYGRDRWFGANDTPLYSLKGALVGGPHTNDYSDGSLTSPPGYQDVMTDYICNEVTIDYNTGLVGAAAFAKKVAEEEVTAIKPKTSLHAHRFDLTSSAIRIDCSGKTNISLRVHDVFGNLLIQKKQGAASQLEISWSELKGDQMLFLTLYSGEVRTQSIKVVRPYR